MRSYLGLAKLYLWKKDPIEIKKNKATHHLKNVHHLPPDTISKEIEQLTIEQLECLMTFYGRGLRGDLLRQWDHQKNPFTNEHTIAIQALMNEGMKTAAQAIEIIKNKTKEEARAISSVLKHQNLPR